MIIGKRIKYLREMKNYTQEELAKSANTSKQNIYKYENGIITNIPSDKIEAIAKYLDVSPSYLMGWEDHPKNFILDHPDLRPITKKTFPLIGTIACGQPITTEENIECYIEADQDIDANYCLLCKGDSMIGAGINDGDVVFVREQPDVENGQIAAVLIDNEATLKRVNKNVPGFLILRAENPSFDDIVIDLSKCTDDDHIRILGKAVMFQRWLG